MKNNVKLIQEVSPLVRLVCVLGLVLSAFIIPLKTAGYLVTLLVCLLAFLWGKGSAFLKRFFLSTFWLFLVIFMLRAAFLSDGPVALQLGFLSFHKAGIEDAIVLTAKIAAFVSSLTLYFLVTPVTELTQNFEEKGLSSKVSYILLVTFYVIPEMRKQANLIMDSQRTRGMESEGNIFLRARAFIAIFVPLVLSSIVNTQEQALALEVRVLGIHKHRTFLHPLKSFSYNSKAKLVTLVYLILCFVWRFLWHT